MNFSDVLFLPDPFASYEDFQQKITESNNLDRIRRFFAILKKINDSPRKLNRLRKQVFGSSNQTNFLVNILWLYRWLVSEGYQEFNEDEIDNMFDFLEKLGVPEFALKHVRWGVAFLKKEGYDSDDEFWRETILGEKMSEKLKESLDNAPTISSLIDKWMLFHIGLKQLFASGQPEFSKTGEMVLTKYINLVNESSELEDIFGVTIEKDMFRIYELFKKETNA